MRIDQLQPPLTAGAPLEIPPPLRDSVLRHQTHLLALIDSLRAAGLDELTVDASIRVLVESYAEDLASAIHAMMKDQLHA
ncbi:hypothetical protein ACFOKI_03360 [Sphingomonas qilianensis]|uniref:Uncharacterized protein n=1 Tax=Sphingomonas qilianensis TaxID=1736690 RepID=A0ABU9XVA2_9SPHN